MVLIRHGAHRDHAALLIKRENAFSPRPAGGELEGRREDQFGRPRMH